jgi:hypothetical protein
MIPTAKETFDMLEKEEKYNIRIKADKNNPKYVTEIVRVNGECILIPVGEDVSVPKTVYECLRLKGVI